MASEKGREGFWGFIPVIVETGNCDSGNIYVFDPDYKAAMGYDSSVEDTEDHGALFIKVESGERGAKSDQGVTLTEIIREYGETFSREEFSKGVVLFFEFDPFKLDGLGEEERIQYIAEVMQGMTVDAVTAVRRFTSTVGVSCGGHIHWIDSEDLPDSDPNKRTSVCGVNKYEE
ncbi:hypothetical protein ACFLZS_01470 [Patescibacteria group bacterium]